jgi:hypothetical protein
MKTKPVLILFLVILLFTVPLTFFIMKESKACDEHVILNDGTEFDCRNVASYSNGMSFIKMCNGEELNVPTHRIKEVRKISTK